MNCSKIDLIEYLLSHKDGLLEDFKSRANPCAHLFPPNFYDVYLMNYKKSLHNEITDMLMVNFNLNYEEINLLISEDDVTLVLGTDFFEPTKGN